VLTERYSVAAVQAFDLLSTLPQNSNTPVRQVAGQVVETVTRRQPSP
jgi:hypothetical protein